MVLQIPLPYYVKLDKSSFQIQMLRRRTSMHDEIFTSHGWVIRSSLDYTQDCGPDFSSQTALLWGRSVKTVVLCSGEQHGPDINAS